jgi:hypothetical protein
VTWNDFLKKETMTQRTGRLMQIINAEICFFLQSDIFIDFIRGTIFSDIFVGFQMFKIGFRSESFPLDYMDYYC